MPLNHPWVYEEQVPGKWHGSNLGAVWVLKINGTVLNIVTAPQKKLTFSVELKGLRWLIYFISSLKIFSCSLFKLGVGSVHNLMEVVYLTEMTRWGGTKHL